LIALKKMVKFFPGLKRKQKFLGVGDAPTIMMILKVVASGMWG